MTPFSNHQRRPVSNFIGLCVAVLALVAFFLFSARAEAATEYGIESAAASLSTLQAGRHPDLTTSISFKASAGDPVPDTENLEIDFPPGLTANPRKFPTCSLAQFNNPFINPCPQDSQIGIVNVEFVGGSSFKEPLYNLPAPEDEVARIGFIGFVYPTTLDIDLRSDSDYGLTVKSLNMPSVLHIARLETTTWGVPADPIHNSERIMPIEAVFCPEANPSQEPCAGGSRSSGLSPEPFLTNPASCQPMVFDFATTSYLDPGQVFTKSADAGEIVECEKVPFKPRLSIAPTSREAGSPTGLEVALDMPSEEAVNTVNSSPLRGARVVLPEGMTVNASAADGLESCSAEQAAYQDPGPAGCPAASKLGTAEFQSPVLKRPIEGGIFLRTPEPGHLFRLWLVSNDLGVNLKVPAEVELDEGTGRLTTVVQESPQLPADKVVLRFNGGARAPLRNPLTCGTSNATYELSPWSGNPPVTGVVPITVDQGCGGDQFSPRLSAGTLSPTAGSFSPLIFDIGREDDEQNLATIDLVLPKGLTAKLAGVPLCPEGATSAGACPESSRIGQVKVAVGAGTQPLWVPQSGKPATAVFLAGPYKGAPYSAVATVPAQAGPFDLGLVTVRSGVYVDPETAQVSVKSDPLPQILQGVPLDYRRVRVEIDREGFTLNPTSCAAQAVRASVLSSGGLTATASDRFQASDCASLGFRPKLSLQLKGGTQRTDHPALRAVLQAKPGQANIRRVSVALPHSEFLEQAHIRTVCTRVQFAADACPKGSIYGEARVVTPLLGQPLSGHVYLRSSSHELPDLVVDLEGQLEITLAGRIDSVDGGIRTTFWSTPDAPISKFALNMKGGQKSLLVNSRDLCSHPSLATVSMKAHNGREARIRPKLRASC
ncbi:MAG TPA: hypothetical protein VNC16_11390 [Solirubrobacterales bacterium]|jgi:hypothetical protein|nr:hypothetical protein [Solirubrobacterales bacterium]